MAESTAWEDQLRSYFSDQTGKSVIQKTLLGYFDQHKNKSKDILPKILSVEFDVDIFDACSGLYSRLEHDSLATLMRCHDILNNSKETFKTLAEEKNLDLPHLRFRLAVRSLQRSEKEQHCVPTGEDAHKLVMFHGTVIKVTNPRILSSAKPFQCLKCKKSIIVQADPEQYNIVPMPARCEHCAQVGAIKAVDSEEDGERTIFMSKDYQEVKVQEKLSHVGMGSIPRSIWVCLDDDLVDKCKPGDDVQVKGTVIRRWGSLGKGPDGSTDIHLAIFANNVCVSNDQILTNSVITEEQKESFSQYWAHCRETNAELEGRNQILAAFCPQVYGLFIIKLAVSVILCGGVERTDANGTSVRGEPHLLMIGDPGTGKSQILRYLAKMTPRSVMTSGIGSTNAGLTVSAVRDGPQWSLEAGALVLADGGLCCIDEFSSIKESDRVAIHEAMEQQSISVAKAGVVTRLRTRCSVVATANPKGKYDPDQPLTVNIGIASPLLSRFDLVYVLLDSKNPDWDDMVSLYILTGEDPSKMFGEPDALWSFDNLKAYFAACRLRTPSMSKEASMVLSKYYQRQRQKEGLNKARATVRLLQSLIRLAQGHARLMYHEEVTICDAINAIILLEVSFDSNPSFLPEINLLHTSFPLNPTQEYTVQAEYILTELGLLDLWLMEEKRLMSENVTEIKPKSNTEDTQETQGISEVKRKRELSEDVEVVRSPPAKKLSVKDKLNSFKAPPSSQ